MALIEQIVMMLFLAMLALEESSVIVNNIPNDSNSCANMSRHSANINKILQYLTIQRPLLCLMLDTEI